MKLHYGIDELKDFDFLVLLPILLPIVCIGLILVLIALIDLYRHRMTRENVLMWTVIIIIGNTVGALLYFIIGRKDRVVK